MDLPVLRKFVRVKLKLLFVMNSYTKGSKEAATSFVGRMSKSKNRFNLQKQWKMRRLKPALGWCTVVFDKSSCKRNRAGRKLSSWPRRGREHLRQKEGESSIPPWTSTLLPKQGSVAVTLLSFRCWVSREGGG